MKIYLNVYDLAKANYYLHSIGFGLYHTGIQVGSSEYHFGGHESSSTGVCQTEPKEYTAEVIFRESVYLGECTLSYSQINNILEELKRDFAGNTYDVLKRNCNHFSNAVSKRLLLKPIPSYVNRMASLGNMFRCCLPGSLVQGPGSDPTKQNSNYASSAKTPETSSYAFKAFQGSGVSIGGNKNSSNKGNSEKLMKGQGFNYIQQQDVEH